VTGHSEVLKNWTKTAHSTHAHAYTSAQCLYTGLRILAHLYLFVSEDGVVVSPTERGDRRIHTLLRTYGLGTGPTEGLGPWWPNDRANINNLPHATRFIIGGGGGQIDDVGRDRLTVTSQSTGQVGRIVTACLHRQADSSSNTANSWSISSDFICERVSGLGRRARALVQSLRQQWTRSFSRPTVRR